MLSPLSYILINTFELSFNIIHTVQIVYNVSMLAKCCVIILFIMLSGKVELPLCIVSLFLFMRSCVRFNPRIVQTEACVSGWR